jgi:hypothetical protein
MSTNKTSRKKTTKHECFLTYASLEPTPHWRKLFEDCACGVFPKGVSYKDGIVYCKKVKKRPTTHILSSQAVVAIDGFKRFLYKELGEISIDDLTKKRLNLDIALRENAMSKDTQWSEIRAPTVKQQLVTLYVSEMKSELELTEEEAHNLKTVLNLGLGSKQITADDVLMKNNKIVEINGIDLDESGFFLTKAPPAPNIASRAPQNKDGQTSCMEGWDKKLNSYFDFMGIRTQ